MSDRWNFYPLLVDGEPASIFVDIGLAETAPEPGHDHLAYLRVKMRNPQEDGLSSGAEFDDLIALEDAVIDAIRDKASAIYVGRNTSAGHRDFYFYVDRIAPFEEAAAGAMQAFDSYCFSTGGRADPAWETYFEFLYPSPEDFQRIANQGVFLALDDNGDQSDLARQIDHWAYFDNEGGRERFAALVRARGFTAVERKGEDGALSLYFFRIDRPADIDELSLELHRWANENEGRYDGWGCEVID